MQVNIQGVEHDLRRIEQIYSRLYNNEDTLGETKFNIEMKFPCYRSIYQQCIAQSDMQR